MCAVHPIYNKIAFAYTDLDKTRITEAVCGSTEFLNMKDCKTLAEYMKVNRIPRGLRVCLCPTLFASDKEFCKRWEAIINKCSSDQMLATMEHLQIERKEKLAHHIQCFRTEVEKRKSTKFQRNANDYSSGRVYRWVRSTQESFGDSRYTAGERQT
ncbi:hypothetical protein XELAEV_18002718mg [Xenopus laevis]|uniref:Uncharacterized protein n=1 Tax=Xenopus laevis TaxID=8355 RepID=A0A974BPX8_XENLA|nr:hypothetical protein XELAEV_18002718mg [Xenopus laevis]